MNFKTSLLVAALVTLPSLVGNAGAHGPSAQGQGMAGHDMSKMNSQGMKGHSAGSMELHKIMATGMNMPMKMSGNVDKDFATMMTMHHQQAIKMADVLARHGQNVKLQALARKMKAAQQAEIKLMAPHTK